MSTMSTQPAHVLRFARHGTAPGHWYTAYVYPTLEPDFYSATGVYRIEAASTADGHSPGYKVSYTPMHAGGEVSARADQLGWEGSFEYAQRSCARHLTARLAEQGLDNQTVAVV